MASRLDLSRPFEHVYEEIALKLRIPSLKLSREFSDVEFLLKFTNDFIDCLDFMDGLMYGVSIRRTRWVVSLAVGNYSSWYTANCRRARICCGMSMTEIKSEYWIRIKTPVRVIVQYNYSSACFVFVCAHMIHRGNDSYTGLRKLQTTSQFQAQLINVYSRKK